MQSAPRDASPLRACTDEMINKKGIVATRNDRTQDFVVIAVRTGIEGSAQDRNKQSNTTKAHPYDYHLVVRGTALRLGPGYLLGPRDEWPTR